MILPLTYHNLGNNQVGDLGAFPALAKLDPATNRHLAADPSEADFSRLLQAIDKRADALHKLRTQFACPVYFIRGNHEDFAWLAEFETPFDFDVWLETFTVSSQSGL